MRVVRLGGPEVRKARKNAADPHEGGDVFMYRDSSAAPLLDLRRWTKAVMDVLDAVIRDGFSFAAQWDEILKTGPVSPVTSFFVYIIESLSNQPGLSSEVIDSVRVTVHRPSVSASPNPTTLPTA